MRMPAAGSCEEQLGRPWEIGWLLGEQPASKCQEGMARAAPAGLAPRLLPLTSVSGHLGQGEEEGGKSYETGATVC